MQTTLRPADFIKCLDWVEDKSPDNDGKTEILKANIGLLPYLPNKSTEGKWPTKLYEYMGYQLPFIIQKNMVSSEFINSSNSGIEFDFTEQSITESQAALEQINSNSFYQKPSYADIYWRGEEGKLLEVVQTVLS